MDHGFPTPPRRRGTPLSQIQTSFNDNDSSRLQRSKPASAVIIEESATITSPRQDSLLLNRHKSKGSLLGFLRRSKPGIESNQKLETSREGGKISGQSFAIRSTQESSQARALRLAREVPVSSSRSSTASTTLQRRTSKSTTNSKSNKKDASVVSLASWDPPELFKAYPQAIRHARLRAPVLQVKAILQLYEGKKAASLEQDVTQNVDHAKRYAGRRMWEKDKTPKQKISEHDGWAEKVYVLATSGYLLEYAGNGAFDRLPEKLMPLGRESAAFASDAIPGEHWVLQVSRIANDDGIASNDGSKSMLKKFRFGNDMRRSTPTLLLVFDNPDDMNSWLVVIRKEIEALGGKKYRPDVDVLKTTDEVPGKLRERPSRQHLVKRDPNRFADQINDMTNTNLDPNGWMKRGELSVVAGRRQSMATQGSIESPSLSNATVSSDQAYLERLKETPRMSYVSAGAKTLSTSRGSSPEPSPARAAFSPEDLIPKPVEGNKETGHISRARQQPAGRVLAPSPIVPQWNSTDAQSEIKSTHAVSVVQEPKSAQSSSPIQSKLSVPSFSKRYSCVTNPTLITPSEAASNTDHQEGRPEPAKNRDSKSGVESKLPEEQVSQPRKSMPTLKPAVSKYSSAHNGSKFPRPSRISSDVNLLRPKPDPTLPRRFSSLEYTGKGSAHIATQAQSSSPHPPPTFSLPALPEQHLVMLKPETRYQDRRFHSRDGNGTRQTRRPASMQIQSDHVTRNKHHPPPVRLQHPSESDEFSSSSHPTKTSRTKRAPPPPPLSLVQTPRMRSRESLSQKTRPSASDSLPEVTTSFLNLEHSPLLPGS